MLNQNVIGSMAEQTAEQDFTGTLHRETVREYMDAINAIVDEAVIEVTDGGIASRYIDPASVAMGRVKLDNGAFVEQIGDEQEFGIYSCQIEDIIHDDGHQHVTLDYDSDRRKLDVTQGPYRYTSAAIAPDSVRGRPTTPQMDSAFQGQLEVEQLRRAVEWFDEFSHHVRMGYDSTNHKFWMEAMERDGSGDIGTDDGVFELDRNDLWGVREAGEADSNFSLDYLRKIVNAIPDGRRVTLGIGEHLPLLLSYRIGFEDGENGLGQPHGEVMFQQAPRIVGDSDD